MLCYVQSVPDFGLMQGTRSQSVLDFGPMQFPDFGPMQWVRPNVCYYVIMCMVCGSLRRLIKLRAYNFKFWFQVLPVAKGRARDDCSAHTIWSA